MNLIKLILKDFQGATYTFEPNGLNASVYADNGVGKSRLYSAYCWLLFSKDCLGRADFEIKNLDAAGNHAHGLSHEVEGTFDFGGRKTVLKKSYHEKWTKKQGSASKEMTGHETDHFVDGVPVSKREYETRLAQLAPAHQLQLLSDPMYFNSLHWQEKRKIVLAVAGDICDSDVIASDKQLEKLPGILNGRTMDDHRKVISARRTEINKELQIIPARIDEATRALPNVAGIDVAKTNAELATLQAELAEKQRELARVQSGGEVAELQRQLQLVQARITHITSQHQAAAAGKASAKQAEIDKLNSQARSIQDDIDSKIKTMQAKATAIAAMEAKLPPLRQQWQVISARQFEHNGATVCPNCEQPLPADRIQAARDKALADFNLAKSQELEANVATGRQTKAGAAEARGMNERLQAEIDTLVAEKAAVADKIAALQGEIGAINAVAADPSGSPEYVEAVKERAGIEGKISALSLDVGAKEKLEAEIKTAIETREKAIRALNGSLAQLDQHSAGQKRIAELDAQQKRLAAEYERLEGELYLADQFMRAKVNLMDGRIGEKFRRVRFKMFEVQVNGGLEPCCETLIGGVPFSGGLNTGHRIIAGLDIIWALARHYGFTAPVFVDNAESVTNLPEMDGQVIRLVKPGIVTEEDRAKYSRLVVEQKSQNMFEEAI